MGARISTSKQPFDPAHTARKWVVLALTLSLVGVYLLTVLWSIFIVWMQCMYWLKHDTWVPLPLVTMFWPSDMIPPERGHPLHFVAAFSDVDIIAFMDSVEMRGLARTVRWILAEVPAVVGLVATGIGAFAAAYHVGSAFEEADRARKTTRPRSSSES